MSLMKKYYEKVIEFRNEGWDFEDFPASQFIVLTKNGTVKKRLEGKDYKEFMFEVEDNLPNGVSKQDFLFNLLYYYDGKP